MLEMVIAMIVLSVVRNVDCLFISKDYSIRNHFESNNVQSNKLHFENFYNASTGSNER